MSLSHFADQHLGGGGEVEDVPKKYTLGMWLDSISFEKQGNNDRQRCNRHFPIETLELG